MWVVLAVAGVACLVYGTTILLTFSGTLFFAVWYVLAAVLMGWSHALRAGLWATLPVFVRVGLPVCAVLMMAAVLWLGALIMRQSFEEPPDDLDYLIVLGAQVYRDGPSEILRYRLDAAYDYLAAHPSTKVIVSGGQGPNEPCPEADVMARYLVQRGIDQSRITRERRSETTKENLVNSWKLIDSNDARVGVVTNSFHLFRSLRLAHKLGHDEVWGIAGGVRPWYLPNNLLRECMGVAKDLLLGNIEL